MSPPPVAAKQEGRASSVTTDSRGTWGSVTRPALAAAVVVVVGFLVAAVLWPHAADGLLRLLLATLAIGYIGVRGHHVMPPIIRDPYSPFGRDPLVTNPAAAPLPLRKLIGALQAADATGPKGRIIPGAICAFVRDEAARRLARKHRLDLDEPRHHAQIRSLVLEPTWLLIRPALSPEQPLSHAHGRSCAVPLSQLDRILDDLERL